MPLPLPVRKGIRDSEPDLKENLEKINNFTGREWSFEVDWEANITQIGDGFRKEDLGSLYQKEIMTNVAACIEKAVSNELTKEALLEATPNSKIVIRVNDKAPAYWVFKIENGDLILEHKKSICNTHDVTYFDLARIIPTQSGAIPLPVRKNIEKNREKQQEILDEIAKVTGSGEWVFEVDWTTVVPKLDNNTAERIGDIYIEEILANVLTLFKNKLTNETTKEAFNEATSARTISIDVNDKQQQYWLLTIKDGGLLITHKKSICNTHDVSYYNLESIIPSPGLITLVAKLNLQSKRESLDTAMEKIKEATGEEFTFDETSVESFYEKLDKSQKDQIGDILYGEIIPNLAQNLKNRLVDEMVKEAFQEITSAKQIAVRMNPKQSNYWELIFENGVLVVSGKAICNTHDITYFDFEKLL